MIDKDGYKCLNVQELIDELMKIEDKSKVVWVLSYEEETTPTEVKEDDDSILIF